MTTKKKATKMATDTQDAEAVKTRAGQGAVSSASGKKSKPVFKIVVAVLLLLILATIVAVSFSGDKETSGKVGEAKLDNIATYLSKSRGDADKLAQTEFKKGDPIQVGFTYDAEEATDDALVRYVVIDVETGEEAFVTNLFKLNPEDSELFVSINNTSLPPANYKVELKDKDQAVIASVEYSIVE